MLAGLIAAGLAGCKDSRRLPPQKWKAVPGPVTVKGIVLDEKAEPSAVATAMLDLLKQCRDVRSHGLGDPQRAAEFEQVRDQIHRLAAADAIFKTAAGMDQQHLMPHDLTAEKAVEIVTNNWPAVVGYYVDGLARDSVFQQVDDPLHAKVTARVTSLRDREVMDRITRSLADQRDARGEPLKVGSEAHKEELKRRAVAEGVCPPIESRIALSLVKESGFWRVETIRVERALPAAIRKIRAPATQPAGTAG